MPKTRPLYAPEFRRQMVDLVRTGRDPEDLAKEFEPTAQSIRYWAAAVARSSPGARPTAWRKRIARLMRLAGLVGASSRRSGVITTRRDKKARPATDLVDRNFTATQPNQLWVADITFVPTADGFLYLPSFSMPGAARSLVGR